MRTTHSWVGRWGRSGISAPLPTSSGKCGGSVFNLLDQQQVINVSQRYEAQPGQVRSTWNTGTRWQSPRYMQLVMTWNF